MSVEAKITRPRSMQLQSVAKIIAANAVLGMRRQNERALTRLPL